MRLYGLEHHDVECIELKPQRQTRRQHRTHHCLQPRLVGGELPVLERSARGLLELLELLDSGMKPPICRSCWKREWNHVCKGPLLAENERPTPAPSLSLLPHRAISAQQQPISDLRAMDDDNFRVAYNAYQAEYMR
jgi:hypothetical protein